MTDNDKKAFMTVMYKLFAIYDMPFENKHLLSAWFDALLDYDIEEVAAAAQRYIKSPDFGTFRPKPADLVKMLEGTSEDRSFLAWTKVEQSIRTIGTYQTVVFDDPVIHRVISDMGGWISLGETLEKDLPFVAKEFMARYRGFAQRQQIPAHPRKLYGLIDAGNGVAGYVEEMQPVMIGDHARATVVLENSMEVEANLKRLLN